MSKATASNEEKRPRGVRADAPTLLTLFACTALTSACAVRMPPEIRSSEGETARLSALDLLAPDAEQSQRMEMHSALSDALGARGVVVSSEATAIGEFAVSSGDATVGVYVSEAGETTRDPRPVAEPRDAHWLDICTPVRVQASLAVFDRASGDLVKRSSAQSTVCQGDDTPYSELAAILTENLLEQ